MIKFAGLLVINKMIKKEEIDCEIKEMIDGHIATAV